MLKQKASKAAAGSRKRAIGEDDPDNPGGAHLAPAHYALARPCAIHVPACVTSMWAAGESFTAVPVLEEMPKWQAVMQLVQVQLMLQCWRLSIQRSYR